MSAGDLVVVFGVPASSESKRFARSQSVAIVCASQCAVRILAQSCA